MLSAAAGDRSFSQSPHQSSRRAGTWRRTRSGRRRPWGRRTPGRATGRRGTWVRKVRKSVPCDRRGEVQATRWSSAGAGNTLIEGPRLSAVLERRGWLPGVLRTPQLYICQVPETSLFERCTPRTCVLGFSHRGGPESAPLPTHYKLPYFPYPRPVRRSATRIRLSAALAALRVGAAAGPLQTGGVGRGPQPASRGG